MSLSFKQILVKKSNILIDIELVNLIKIIPTDKFIKEYKISNFWTGKFFIKRLINKIFKYQLNKKLIWTNDFWNKISIELYESQISSCLELEELNNKISETISPSRLYNVNKFSDLLKSGSDLGCPLYISSDSLNLLGSKMMDKKFYILDGSRRLAAYMLNELHPKIIIINIKK